jgi:serine/threonine protein kinase
MDLRKLEFGLLRQSDAPQQILKARIVTQVIPFRFDTEFIDGETLRARMLNTLPMKLSEILDAANQTASALLAAHAANIVHRDIKPENIILRRDGIVKVLDFGLAKLLESGEMGPEDATRPLVKTDAGMVMGTVAYMSPEQARGLKVDARTDIWR